MKNLLLMSAAGITLLVNSAVAEAGEITLGAGVASFETGYKDFKDDNGGFIFAEYSGDNFSIGSHGLGYRLLGDEDSPLNIYANLGSVGDGFDQNDSTHFSGMAERDSSIDLGLIVDYQIGNGFISGSFMHDVSGAHEGFVADLNYSHSFELGGHALFIPTIGVSYLSEDYVDYYYGVRSSEATASRAAYKGDATFNTHVGYDLVFPLTENWELVQSSQYSWLGEEIEDSSLVDRDNSWSASLAITYRF